MAQRRIAPGRTRRASHPSTVIARNPAAQRARTRRILDTLEKAHPEATCALHHRNPFELIVATILSAQCTDARVNQVTPLLFEHFPTAAALAEAEPMQVEGLIRPTGFFRAKARSIVSCAAALVARHGGQVPPQMDDLVKLPGVGRKTANVVLGHAFGASEGIVVDTHVLRVSNRVGLARADDPKEVEAQLMAVVPRQRWTRAGDLLIFHGRKVCFAQRPACGACPVLASCAWPDRSRYAAPPAQPQRTLPAQERR